METQINDAMRAALNQENYAGQLNDQLSAWLASEGAGAIPLADQWAKYFTIKGIAPGQYEDRYFAWLGLEGFTQDTLADRKLAYWIARASV